jgi:ubiquinone/menaquinone biosynthesis C-methylase UbiE
VVDAPRVPENMRTKIRRRRCGFVRRRGVRSLWDDAADGWVEFVRTGRDYDRDEKNNPAMFRMLGDIQGKRILDLACGEGYNARIMARKGGRVSGVDFSRKMIGFATLEGEMKKLRIDYHVSDASNLRMFKQGALDIVARFMAVQDIRNYRAAFRETSRILKESGRFLFSIPHPCFERRVMDGKMTGGWEYKRTGEEALYYKVDRYFQTHGYIIPWKMKRLTKHFETISFHRTLTDYVNALHDAGLTISRLEEPVPTKSGIPKHPDFHRGALRIPSSIVIEAVNNPRQIRK